MYVDEVPTRGAVWIGSTKSPGIKRSAIPQLRRKLGVVFQDFRLLEDRTVEQNVAFALEVVDTPSDKIATKVSRLLTRVGLASKATNFPRELSGGEQQRVAIARALVNDPFLLIADEPTGNLDDRATRGVFQLLKDINNAGTAVIMATHNMELVRRNEYRVLEVNRGQLVFDSSEQKRTEAVS
jgi:cell division transport system ATP-binding protein